MCSGYWRIPFGRASGIELLKSRWWIGERRRPGEKSPQGCLSGLFVTDSKGWFLLGGLYMALFRSMPSMSCGIPTLIPGVFPLLVPYIGEVVFSNC